MLKNFASKGSPKKKVIDKPSFFTYLNRLTVNPLPGGWKAVLF